MNLKILNLVTYKNNKLFFVFLLYFGFVNSNSKVWSKTNNGDLSFFESLIHQPIVGSFEQTIFTHKFEGITKFNLGFAEEKIQYGHEGGGYIISKDFCKIGLGYKFYSPKSIDNLPYFDFSLYKWKLEASMGFHFGASLDIFDKKTTYYSNNYIDWAKAGIILGVAIPYYRGDNLFKCYIHGSLGYTTLQPDTLIILNLKNELNKFNYRIGDIKAVFKMNYKALSLEFSGILTDGTEENNIRSEVTSLKLFYILWNGRTYTASDENQSNVFSNIFQIYFSFTNDKLTIINTKDSKNPLYSNQLNMFNLGISYNFGSIYK